MQELEQFVEHSACLQIFIVFTCRRGGLVTHMTGLGFLSLLQSLALSPQTLLCQDTDARLARGSGIASDGA
jgi:hypothetical protein